MADVQPIRALHYDQAVAGPLQNLVAPPYDVIDPAQRAELASRSPYNVVALDLPQDPADGDQYAHAARLLDMWRDDGALTRYNRPALWPLVQEYDAPDGRRLTRRGVLARVRVEDYGPGRIRPHERTHPGPKEDRLRLTRATKTNLSPIFSLYSDPQLAAWSSLEPFTSGEPWGEATDDQGTLNRLWRVTDPAALNGARAALAEAELLIADGHHRYETARVYADEIGGEGEHRYVLMCLVALEDEGLTVFPTHRLVIGPEGRSGPAGAPRRPAEGAVRHRARRARRAAPAGRLRTARARVHRQPPEAGLPPDAEGSGRRRRRTGRLPGALPHSSTPRCSRRSSCRGHSA